jgi:hypothetical protein
MEDMSEEEVIRQAYEQLRSHPLREVLEHAGIHPDLIVESSDLLIPLSPRYRDEEREPEPQTPAAEAA